MIKNYIPKSERKKILLLSDDLRFFSGCATISRELVKQTSQHFNWIQLAGAAQHPDPSKKIDISDSLNKELNIEDANVTLFTINGYGNIELVRDIIDNEKPDALLIFTDPRYWIWLFEHEREIRSQIPIIYLNIWDNLPYPMYNQAFYKSCDALLAISKQTENINRVVLGKDDNRYIKYLPHGIDEKLFFPIDKNSLHHLNLLEYKNKLFKGKEYDFILFFNSRNIGRKNITNLLLAWKRFIDNKDLNVALLLHTHRVDSGGTDLNAVIEMLFDESEYNNIYFSENNIVPEQMNLLYNISDCVILPSSQEGWGLSITEGLMSGKPIIGTVTGGIQDQMRFEDEEGNWIKFSEDFGTNHRGKYKKCGEWAFPIFPSDISLIGSPPTPYIYDDKVTPEDIYNEILVAYSLGREELQRRGLKGHEWVMSEEAGMTASKMGETFIESVDEILDIFQPKPAFTFEKVEFPKISKHYNKNIVYK